ncbi:MAG: AAA family ATPase [Marinobacterium sp.]|nr:AAA family ATPase [Marinobacterium sp.]
MMGLTAETADGPFIEPASRAKWVDKLLHFIRYSELTLVLEGPLGVGKTTLLRQLRPSPSDSTLKLTEVTLSTATDTSELLNQVISKLPDHSQQSGDDRARLQYLYSYGQALKNAGQHWVLIIDEAQHLDAPALEILLNFMMAHHGDGHPPQLLLSGSAGLGQLLSNSHLATSQAGRIHRMLMDPLDTAEATIYLKNKFPGVAKQPEKLQQKLVHESHGLPAEIDRLAALLLNTGKVGSGRKPVAEAAAPLALMADSAVASPAQLGPEPVLNASDDAAALPTDLPAAGGKRAAKAAARATRGSARAFPLSGVQLGIIGVVLTGITGGAVWQFMPRDEAPVAQAVSTGPDSRVSMQLNLDVEEKPDPNVVAEQQARSRARMELEKRLAAYENRSVNLPPVAEAPLTIESDQPPLPVNRVVTELTPKSEQPTPPPQTARVVAQQPLPVAQAQPAPTPVAVPPVVAQQPAPVVVKKPEPAPVVARPAPKPAPQAVGPREVELLSWPASGFTLQLQGSRSAKSALEFIRRQPDRKNFYYFTTIYKGGPWHVVVYGRYDSREAAMADVGNLPSALRSLRPWARTVAGVQADIRKK